MLSSIGFAVESHHDHFQPDEDDPVWIKAVAARGWVILSGDKRISRDPVNAAAVRDSKAQVVSVSNNNIPPEYWGAALINGRLEVFALLDKHPGPVYIQISEHAKDHVRILDRGNSTPVKPILESARTEALAFAAFLKF